LTVDFFDSNFDRSYYSKYEKSNIIYFNYIFEFFHILNKTG
jgi:hypothetical protein